MKFMFQLNQKLHLLQELKVIFNSLHHHSPRVRKILQLFRLRQIGNATLVRLNKATSNMLQHVNYCVAWGYPTRATLKKLLYSKGYGVVKGQRIPLTSNEVVENSLGNLGLVCMEDLLHELVTCGPNFKKANKFLWPFKLSSPRGGMKLKRKPYQNGGSYGNREGDVNALVTRMLPRN